MCFWLTFYKCLQNNLDGDLQDLRRSVDKKRGHFVDGVDASKIQQYVGKGEFYKSFVEKIDEKNLYDFLTLN